MNLVALEDRTVPAAFGLFETGVDAAGVALATDAVDSHYTLTSGGLSAGGIRALSDDGFPIGPWLGNDAASRWVVPAGSSDNGDAAPGTYVYRAVVDTTGFDAATVTVSGFWAADDWAVIRVNGVDTASTTAHGFGALTGFTLSGFTAGVNAVEFAVVNGDTGGPNPTGLRVTGVTGSGVPDGMSAVAGVYDTAAGIAGTGAVDSHYAVTGGPAGFTGAAVAVVPNPAYYVGGGSSGWVAPPGGAAPEDAPVGDYTFTTSFDLTGFDAATASLSGRWATDNVGVDILLNGVSIGASHGGPDYSDGVRGFLALDAFAATGGFAAGVNTLSFVVRNQPRFAGDPANPAGLRVEGLRVVAVVPVVVSVSKFDDATEGGTSGAFLFSRTGDTSQDLIVNYTVDPSASTATSSTDYAPLSGTVTIAAGWKTAFVFVTATDDRPDYDPDETVSLTATSGSGYSVGSQSSATVTIADSAAATFVLDGSVGHIWYDFPWGEYDESLTSQSVPLEDFTLSLAGQTIDSSTATSGTFTTAPTAEFTNGVFTGLKFAIDTSGLPVYPFSSVSMDGVIVSGIASATGQVFQIAAPVEAPKKPTSQNLSWNDFKKVQTLGFDAYTSTNWTFNADDITATSKPYKMVAGKQFIAEATLNFKFTSEFDPKKTERLNIPGRWTPALLKHERLHLAIGEYMMKKQLLNLPIINSVGDWTDSTATAAENAAKDQVRLLANIELGKITDAVKAINKLYDDTTENSADKAEQANWEAKYTKIMDAYLKDKFKWAK